MVRWIDFSFQPVFHVLSASLNKTFPVSCFMKENNCYLPSFRLSKYDIYFTNNLTLRKLEYFINRRERNVLFNDALNTFYLRLYGVRHMVKDHSDSERGNPLPPHRLLFPISSKGSFICIIPQIG